MAAIRYNSVGGIFLASDLTQRFDQLVARAADVRGYL
jgi:hypothetical protein